jgi:hypothetical protein
VNKPIRRGIPTLYKGTLLRSRTEARWAALLDAFGWAWTYEPFDLHGWIPDFLVTLDGVEHVIEVKSTDEDFDGAMAKIDCSGWEGPVLLVGHSLDHQCCGRFRCSDGVQQVWGELEIFRCSNWDCISPLQVEGSWHCRLCGAREHNKLDFDIDAAFAAASNRVQWRPE